MSKCKQLIAKMESIAPNKFMFYLERDPQTSGNFEVTLFKSESDFNSLKNGQLIHSKKSSGAFPFTNGQHWGKFSEVISNFLKKDKPFKISKKEEPELDMTCIESDSDFETKGLNDMDIEQLDKMVDKRPSPFWKKSWGEVFLNVIIWAIVVYINECGYLNPHDPNYIFADYSIPPPPKWLEDMFNVT